MSTSRGLTSRNPVQARARYARFGANNPMVNSPDGYPSGFEPISWLDHDGAHGAGGWWYGIDSGGLQVPIGPHGPWIHGPASAVSIRATALICGPLTAAPFRVLDQVTVGRPVPTPPWLRDPMLLREDGRISGSVQAEVVQLPRSGFWFSWIRDALWHGLGAFLFEPDQSGQPTAGTLRLIDSRYLYTTRVGQALHWTLDSGSDDPAVFDRDGFITLGAVTYRIVVLRNPHSPVDAEGMSLGVFGLAPGAFKLSGQIAAYASGTFRSGIPAGYLKVNTPGLTQEVASDLKRRWMASHGGDRRAIAVLNATTEFVPMNFSPVDAALGEMTRLSVADVAYAFGLAPDNLGVSLSGSATYSNVRDHFQALRDFGLAPWIAAVQEVLSALLPGSAGVVVNLDGFANPPLSERVATGAQAVAAGLLTTDEWRALEGLPPLPEPPPTPEPELPAPEEEPEPQRHLRIQPWRGG